LTVYSRCFAICLHHLLGVLTYFKNECTPNIPVSNMPIFNIPNFKNAER
jgi:hypothetical protein